MALEIQRAIIFATMKHREQKRKGTDIPYIVHPMECMQILSACGCPDNVIIAGILHDTLEDTDTTPQEILENFGKDVLEIVQNESEDKSKTWKERKQATLDHLKDADSKIKIVCFADKLSNLRSIYRDYCEIGNNLWDRFNADRDSLKWYYNGFLEIFRKIEVNGLCEWRVSNGFFKEYEALLQSVFE